MKQGLQFPLFGGMLLLISTAAGVLIPVEVRPFSTPSSTVQTPQTVSNSQNQAGTDPVKQAVHGEPDVLPASEPSAHPASLKPATSLIPLPTSLTDSADSANSTNPADSPVTLVSASTADDPEATRRLIRQSFPDADAATVDVWAETFQGLPAAEIVDILEHKKLLSGSLDSIFTPGLQSPGRLSLPRLSDDLREREQAASRRNLRHAWTVGYRRRLVLSHAPADTAAAPASGLEFIDFSPGRRVRSPQPLHVAFAENPLHMFLLQDGRLTRRGDFSILPDGMLGITTADGSCQLRGAPRIADQQVRLRVTETGELQAAVAGDTWNRIGRLTAAEVLRPELLTTDDGVHFQPGAPDGWRELLPEEIRLLPGTLELANVDPAEELQRLDALER